jgi:NAD(P)H-dependent FMN reductase
MSKLLIIIGSTRPTRAADLVIPWLTRAAKEHGGFDVEVADLRDWPLPIFTEHFGTIGDINDPTYSDPLVKAWNNKIKEHDAFIVVTPEYNHSYPAGLKAAIDWHFTQWAAKPVAFVSYGGPAGGRHAVLHLENVFTEMHAVTIRDGLSFPRYWENWHDGRPDDPGADSSAKVMLDQLTWWATALRKARADAPYPGA